MQIKHFIGNEFQAPVTSSWQAGVNPATGAAFYQLALGDQFVAEQAVAAAQHAFPTWASLPAAARAAALHRLADLVEANLDELAALECQDTGKPLQLARSVDVPRCVENFRFFANACTQFASESHANERFLNYTLRDPLGVVACISPWNLPLYLLSWKIAPALAMGNCVVAKPSELTPLTADFLMRLVQQADWPPGVLNVVHGLGQEVGEPLCLHPDVKAVSFTGGSKTGAQLAEKLAPQFKKYSLECGGKNAALVFADCDLEQAVTGIVKASFSNQGQICLCASRIFVERSLYARFRDALLERMTKLIVGNPLQPETNLGSVISAQHRDKIATYVESARAAGATVHAVGEATQAAEDGFYVLPTMIEGLAMDHACWQEEIFGPVVCLQAFDSEAEAIALANDTDYGLSATLWTTALGRAHRVARRLEAGMVWINCWLARDLRTPFGGMKSSGVGREGGQEALRFFTEPKNVCLPFESEGIPTH